MKKSIGGREDYILCVQEQKQGLVAPSKPRSQTTATRPRRHPAGSKKDVIVIIFLLLAII